MTKYLFGYQYLAREFAFRVLRRLPLPIKNFGVSFFVKKRKKWLEKLGTPAQIILYVTNRCNARCSHCFYWQEVASGIKKELSLSQIKKIAKTLANPLATLSITGGEPFLRDDLVQICQAFFELNRTRKINIVTNGFFTKKIKETTEKILEKCPIDLNIQVSLDGLQKTHDKIRKISIFEKATETIRVLGKLSTKFKNFQVTVETTIGKQNLNEVVDLGKFIKKKFPSVHHGFQFVRSASFDVYGIDKKILSGLDPESKEPLLSVKEMEKAFKNFSQFSDKRNSLLSSYVKVMNKGIIKMKKEKRPFVKCLAGKYDVVIWPDGQVSMCEFTKPFANLKDFDFDFSALWKSKEANKIRKKIRACFCTHTCNLLNSMQFDKKVLLEVLSNASG
jgi:MoaA/NifB/PqqE/SkfB family radical SAM enzyme